MSSLIETVRAFCAAHDLLGPGPLVVAVSGGADSLALLHILLALRAEFGLALHVATLDHGLRGAASADDVRFVCETAAALNVPVTSGTADVPALARAWRLGTEAAARQARYAFLLRVAGEIGARTIVTGHNRDDQAETVLLHVIRGSGLAGLRGMLPKTPLATGVALVRPLLGVPRAALEAYLRERGLAPRLDATNADTRYIRNRLRHTVLPLLESINPNVREALARLADLAREDYALLCSTLPPFDERDGVVTFRRSAFLALLPAQRRMLIRLAAERLVPGLEIGFERTAGAVRSIEQGRTGFSLGNHLRLRLIGDSVILLDPRVYPVGCPWLAPGARLAITGIGQYALPGSGWTLSVAQALPEEGIPADPLGAVLALPPGAQVGLRTVHPGDRFRPRGLGGHSQKLSDTLVNMKVLAEWRDRLPVLVVDDQVAWFVAPVRNGPRGRISESFAGRLPGRSWLRFRFHVPEKSSRDL